MTQNLRALAGSLDAHLNDLERRCARMMTALKPTFINACLEVPEPPPIRPLDRYPLDMHMQSITKATPEAARWILLKARREASHSHLKALGEGKSSTQQKTEHACKVETLLKAIFNELHRYEPHIGVIFAVRLHFMSHCAYVVGVTWKRRPV